mgnify:CR=1 FL=1
MEAVKQKSYSADALLAEFFAQDDLKSLAADAGALLDCPLLVLDDTFHVVAYHRPLGFSDPLFQASVSRGEITYEAGAIISRSEALMAELRKRGIPSRVLICRGQTGREWLSEELLSEGADVQKLMCYERLPLQLTVQQEDELREAMKGPAPVTYITSSEAIVSLLRAVHPVEGAWEWITSGAVVVIHPRSESKVLEAGFHLVRMSSPIDDEVEKNVIACAEGLG